MASPEGVKTVGQKKDIPAPSGQYRVGCVDLIHHLEGDDKGGLLVRLHYPTEASPGAEFSLPSWYPHRRYIRGTMEAAKVPIREESITKIISKCDDVVLIALYKPGGKMGAWEGGYCYIPRFLLNGN